MLGGYLADRAPNGTRDIHGMILSPGRPRFPSWFGYFRSYGPEQAAFGKTWKPGDFGPRA